MLFKKKKTDETEVESQATEYTPEELQLINNLVEDFNKAPGHVDIPAEEGEIPSEAETGAEEAAEVAPEPVFKPRAPTEPSLDLGEFEDLAEMDLESMEAPEEIPAAPEVEPEITTEIPEEPEFGEVPEELPPEEELGAEAFPEPEEIPEVPEAAPEAPLETFGEDFDLGLPETEIPEEVPGFEEQPEIPAGEFDLEMPAPELPEEELPTTIEEAETPPEAPVSEFDFEIPSEEIAPTSAEAVAEPMAETPVEDFDFELPSPETTQPQTSDQLIDEMGLGEVPTEFPTDFTMEDMEPAQARKPVPEPAAPPEFSFDDMTPPSLDDVTPEVLLRKETKKGTDLAAELSDLAAEQTEEEISESQLSSLRYTLKSYSPAMRQNVIDIILGNQLKKDDTGELVNKLIRGDNEFEIKKFIEEKLGKKVAGISAKKKPERKVIVSRKQYTESGIERQERLLKYTRFALVAVPLIVSVFAGVYLFGIKKILYNRDIVHGKEIILSPSFSSADIPKAEVYFEKAAKRYPDKSSAYLQFADAYRRQGLYENAFEKLFGKVSVKTGKKAVHYEGQEINENGDFWSIIQKVPIVRYADKTKRNLSINGLEWTLHKPGAYIITHLDNKSDEAIILYALGEFHSSPARKFSNSPYRNIRLGIDYYNRILNFKSTSPAFQKDKFISRAILGIGDVYYHNGDYNRAHDYFEKIIRKNPYDVDGQTGMLKTLIKMYESPLYQTSDDPRLIIQQHSLIKHTYKIEKKLPLFMLAKLARFYIDLPDKDNLRIEYNTSPIDRVNNKTLKSRAEELLNILYGKTDEDIYGNVISGKTFAEGYYQRGRYFRFVVKEYRMAMSQFEYAYKYDPNHFMALNDRAEILMELNDYEGAQKHLKLAEEKISEKFIDTLGDRPEDETLLDADRGIVIFNLAKSIYLSRVKGLDTSHDWMRIQETEKFETSEEYGREALVSMMDQVDMYFDKAENEGLKNDAAQAELAYYRGWINYLKNDYARSLFFWQSISPSWDKKMPNLELAKSYAFYYLATKNPDSQRRYLESSLSHLYYLESKYAPMAEHIAKPNESNKTHDMVFSKMSIIENNMGAIFELLDQEESALKHYQQSIEYSKKINKENEIAHLNIRLSFKRENLEAQERYPLIMDFISPYLQEDNTL